VPVVSIPSFNRAIFLKFHTSRILRIIRKLCTFVCDQYTWRSLTFEKELFFVPISASIPWIVLKYHTEHCEVMRYNRCKFGCEQTLMQSTNKVFFAPISNSIRGMFLKRQFQEHNRVPYKQYNFHWERSTIKCTLFLGKKNIFVCISSFIWGIFLKHHPSCEHAFSSNQNIWLWTVNNQGTLHGQQRTLRSLSRRWIFLKSSTFHFSRMQ
jgi:hypothetical protein